MTTNLPKEKIALFDKILTCMRLALKNSALYPLGHPAFDSAISSFKANLDKWLLDEDGLALGISADNVLLDGEFIRDDSDLYKETADYLHPRGIIAISFTKNIDISELSQLFAFLKYDTETFFKKGGIARNIPATPHLIIKEIDYSSILTSAQSNGAPDEKGVWKLLSSIEKDLKSGNLPESKSEFMRNFLKDSKSSAHVLNEVYKEALAGLHEKSTAEEMRNIFSRINRYFQAHHTEGATEAKKEMADIISNLDPLLLESLFQQKDIGGEGSDDLAENLFGGQSDDMISDFIVSLMQNHDAVNENLIKLFNKLSTKKDGSDGVTSLAADKLFDKKSVSISALSNIQLSIKDLFKENPDNDFISQIYKMTVGILIDKNEEITCNLAVYAAITKEYSEFLKDKNLDKEKIRLLLDILWQEDDPASFKKICGILIDSLRGVLDMDHPGCILEIFDLFTEKLRPEQLNDSSIKLEVQNVIDKMQSPEIIAKLISSIPGADQKALEDISHALVKMEDRSAKELLNLLTADEGCACKDKITYVLSRMSAKQAAVIASMLESLLAGTAAPSAVKNTYNIVKALDPARAHALAMQMLRHKDREIRLQAIEEFRPKTEADKDAFLEVFDKETDPVVKKKALSAMISTGDKDTICKLFERSCKGFAKRAALRELIKLCGDFKAVESVPHLGRIVARRPFLCTKSMDRIRGEAIVSLGRIGTVQALEYVKKASGDRSRSVRTMCEVVLKPSEKGI